MSIEDIQIIPQPMKSQCMDNDDRTSYKKRRARPLSAYGEKLKNPQWQKLRLQILERDGWACQSCFDEGKTLQVHHCYYAKGDPWNTPPNCLITLCEDCHKERQEEEEKAKMALGEFMAGLRYDQRRTFINSLIVVNRERKVPLVVRAGAVEQLASQLSGIDISGALNEKIKNNPDIKFV